MINKKMKLMLKEIEEGLLNEVNDSEGVVKIPFKVAFDSKGRLCTVYGTDTDALEVDYDMDNEKMILILKKIEKGLISQLKDNETIIKIPIKVAFNSDGGVRRIYGVDPGILFEKYNK